MIELEHIAWIDRTIESMNRMKHDLEVAMRPKTIERAKENVGRCFRDGYEYAKIIAPPSTEWEGFHTTFNGDSYNAVFVTSDPLEVCPFGYGTLLLNTWSNGEPYESFKEITPEEFNTVFCKAVADFVSRVRDTSAESGDK